LQENIDQDNLLKGAVSWQLKPNKSAEKIGDVTRAYLGTSDNRLRKNALIVDAWNRVLPAEMGLHCRLTGISGKALYVEVEPGPYMHEMRVMEKELLDYLRSQCPAAKIKKIILRPSGSPYIEVEKI